MGVKPGYLNQTAPCSVCGRPVTLTAGQKTRVTAGKAVLHGGACLVEHRKQQAHRQYLERRDAQLAGVGQQTCKHCSAQFVPSLRQIQRHNAGEAQHWFCSPICAGRAQDYYKMPHGRGTTEESDAEDEERRKIIRAAHFSDKMPDVRHFRRVW